jgi:hypothetical protein
MGADNILNDCLCLIIDYATMFVELSWGLMRISFAFTVDDVVIG